MTSLVKVWPGRPPWLKHKGTWVCISLWDGEYFRERSEWRAKLLERKVTRMVVSGHGAWRRRWTDRYALVGLKPPTSKPWSPEQRGRQRKLGRLGGRPRRTHCLHGHPIVVYCGKRVCYTCKMQNQKMFYAKQRVHRAMEKFKRLCEEVADERTRSQVEGVRL